MGVRVGEERERCKKDERNSQFTEKDEDDAK